ncbi:hypothetical protein Ahy_A06g027765 [Arachis hypogaea]|uniref:Uncharacterized protein n=1 Tax=Arachis hypogaea TaxID=3818 RepID=A0A445CPV0_ARAHY|nr:hypothetical protein Ahy_A06g027765 [Arachis hypogaea]
MIKYIETWNPNNQEFQCAGVALSRFVLRRNALRRPFYSNAPQEIFIYQGPYSIIKYIQEFDGRRMGDGIQETICTAIVKKNLRGLTTEFSYNPQAGILRNVNDLRRGASRGSRAGARISNTWHSRHTLLATIE